MIKCIVSDLDGTLLLDGAQELSMETLGRIERLQKLGIVFISASGRQYANQKRLYSHLADSIPMICENGGLSIYRGKVIGSYPIEPVIARQIYEAYRQEEGQLLISGLKQCYVFPYDEEYISFIRDTLQNKTKVIDSFDEIKEPIVKISLMRDKALDLQEKYAKRWADKVSVVLSGETWLDSMSILGNKANALKCLLESLGISRLDTIAFGDNYNDIEMLQLVGFPIAMEKAVQPLREIALARTSSVDDSLDILFQKYEVEK